jgi:glucose 1-dehydrogenase
MTKKLSGKIAVVTGADSGIGQATAIAFAAQGADVVVPCHVDEAGAHKTQAAVEAQGQRAIVVPLDVTNEDSVEAMFDAAIEAFGTVDILVNDAGVDASGIRVADLDTATWDKAIKTNLYGYFFCCRRFIRIRQNAAGVGKIIQITSVHQEQPRAGAADYDCSKGGQRNLTSTLALELSESPRININNIAPGMVLTPFNQKAIDDPAFLNEQVQSIPWKRAAQPEEIARVAVFLASEDADYITGTTVFIDGGLMQNTGQGA